MKQLHLRLDDQTYDVIAKAGKDNNVSLQDLAQKALAEYVTKINQDKAAGNDNKFRFIDLFAGIGGMRLAFEEAGGTCVYSNEWNKYCQQTYFTNFGEIPEDDITKVDAADIPDHDILVAGFPCQPFSIAGVSKKKSMGRATGFEDKTQGTLFFDDIKISSIYGCFPGCIMNGGRLLAGSDHYYTKEQIYVLWAGTGCKRRDGSYIIL